MGIQLWAFNYGHSNMGIALACHGKLGGWMSHKIAIWAFRKVEKLLRFLSDL